MNNKTIIYNKLLELNDDAGIDAGTLASLLGMSRANVSHELNNLYREGKVDKSKGRPVLYSIKESNEKNVYKIDEFVKHNRSLEYAVEQAKAAILYPPNGIPTILLGETGVGKSMFASLMHDYAVEMGVKEEDAPFIVFNCADYSNNPQLLVSYLFGVKKGTYTGAESDRAGLIEKADGGILFLDEVHRLPPEGQEALFTFLDTGTFRRMGDYENRQSDVLIISATTEEPNSALLTTFLRRIPMTIKIPSLKERTFDERLFLIKSFFMQESIKLKREIYVSCNTIRAFLSYDCPNNIGQLKSDVQLSCAKAYSEFLTNIRPDVRIETKSLPPYIKEGLLKESEHRKIWNRLVDEEIEFFRFYPTMQHQHSFTRIKDNGIYDIIEQKLDELKSQGLPDLEIESILEKDITKFFQKYIKGISEEVDKKGLTRLISKDVLNCVDKVVEYMSTQLERRFSNSIYTAIALHINTLINRINNNKRVTNPQLYKIKKFYPREFNIALQAKKIIEDHINLPIPEDEAAYLTIFMLPEGLQNFETTSNVKVIVMAHGDDTATSMVNVANELLGEDYAIGINAPLDISPSNILDQLKEIVREDINESGYLFLVDMGSLTVFAEVIAKEFNVPTKVIPLASTLHVIEATRKAMKGFSLDEIYRDVLLVNSYIDISRKNEQSIKENNKVAIVTACLTGEGGSIAAKSILESNLTFDKDLFEIIALNCLDRKYFLQQLKKLQEEKEILFIVSSFSFDTNIKQYDFYEVINGTVMEELQELIDVKTTLINMPLILKENIDNLDGRTLYSHIDHFINKIKESLSIGLTESTLVGLILHTAFMISSMKKGKVSDEYPQKEEFIDENKPMYEVVEECSLFLNEKYDIAISDNEICYIMNYLLQGQINKKQEIIV